jgi:predicted nucleic acid-binding Zn ribbon protein
MAEAFAVDFYLRMKRAVTGRKGRDEKRREAGQLRATSKPFEKGRDPITVLSGVDGLLNKFDWSEKLAKAELFVNWTLVVGDASAASSKPEELQQGLLVVRCKSTAWATELRIMQDQIIAKINELYPTLRVAEIKFVGPDAPSWKKGKYSVPGRGPRDTYG